MGEGTAEQKWELLRRAKVLCELEVAEGPGRGRDQAEVGQAEAEARQAT